MRAALLLLTAMSLNAASPRIAIIGGPQPLWTQIVGEFQHRYPALDVQWELYATSEPLDVDLIFAYYPDRAWLKASQYLGGCAAAR